MERKGKGRERRGVKGRIAPNTVAEFA